MPKQCPNAAHPNKCGKATAYPGTDDMYNFSEIHNVAYLAYQQACSWLGPNPYPNPHPHPHPHPYPHPHPHPHPNPNPGSNPLTLALTPTLSVQERPA